ncbi:ceramidase domain-containing protein [Echinimonas agarilytica]|uniref:Ceramidase n=1 Tax=Echinimonas agarilytica TaxID=1215918 RepID=A0AA42B7E6_9GAMM|nr:ceramidase domain-containing protein [Echinimonas agarilytica]MCM2679870.1 ceramidase [Echinimonas agarilytica]
MLTQLNNYCERLDFSFWSEPANALTNIGFILVGMLALSLLNRGDTKPLSLTILAMFMVIIGIGSFLFHTFATRWAMLADIIPIYIFQIIFLFAYPRQVLKLSWVQTSLCFVLYIAVVLGSKYLPFSLNGSEMYLPTIAALVVFSMAHKRRYQTYDRALMLGSVIFAASLLFRTIDQAICSTIPLGTHFLWHSLNSLVLFLCWFSIYRYHALLETKRDAG